MQLHQTGLLLCVHYYDRCLIHPSPKMFQNTGNSDRKAHFPCGRRSSFHIGYCWLQIPNWWQAMPFAGAGVFHSTQQVYPLPNPDLPSLHDSCSACPLPAGTNLGLHRLPCTSRSWAAAGAGQPFQSWNWQYISPSAYSLQSVNPRPTACCSVR